MKTILLLEDDTILAETLQQLLHDEGFKVLLALDGDQALDLSFQECIDLMLLDVNVPQLNGFELLTALREATIMTPAIFITALSDINSLTQGFNAGANDYIKKPFDFDELLLRINALIQREFHSYQNRIELDAFSFDITKSELYKNGLYLALAPYELQLTTLFFKNINTTLHKELILQTLSHNGEASEGALRVHIAKLRKLELPITTVKGTGYRLEKA